MPRLKILPASQLRPERFWVDRFSFETRADRSDREGDEPRVKADVQFRGGGGELPNDFLVRLVLESSAAKQDSSPYEFSLQIAGLFVVDPGLSGDERNRMIRYNAPAVLYGLARGYVANATALGRAFEPLILPAVNLVEALHPPERSSRANEAAEGDPDG